MGKNCEECENRNICEIRKYFSLGKGDNYMKVIAKNPDDYAALRIRILNDISEICKYARL